MAEVGVLRGKLSDYLLRRAPGLHLTMVDNWLTTDQQPEAYRATRDDHALHTDAARVERHKRDARAVADRYRGQAEIVEGWSAKVAARFPDRHFDAVFLDADHSEAGVRADITAWLPKVKMGGWIGGHDIDNEDPRFDFSGVRRAVDAHFSAVDLGDNFTWFARVE
ncbi:class I SAM-dependent methyltransferase [Rhodobacter sp. NTK016B]|uniref:class I SAM-dependent methyltransferase n=1 Tax=Rhodobacter sp. NTK016B TaxID=2759676 RepID=UPI001A8E74F8|nr:class I SAM-dependent methyltransferase [Rhodobacter sp. NTK016B]MBN8292818.1 class I SAM-dependent methyltransferase [Rhodobacter sp. NTK016B]